MPQYIATGDLYFHKGPIVTSAEFEFVVNADSLDEARVQVIQRVYLDSGLQGNFNVTENINLHLCAAGVKNVAIH